MVTVRILALLAIPCFRRGVAAPNVTAIAAQVRPDGGGGAYGPNSGGYDQLGSGTLTFTLDPKP